MQDASIPILKPVRSHWGIENPLHLVWDMAFREDECRVRKGNGPENLSVLRRMAMNLLRRDNGLRVGIEAKRNKAGWDEEYLLYVLANQDAIALAEVAIFFEYACRKRYA